MCVGGAWLANAVGEGREVLDDVSLDAGGKVGEEHGVRGLGGMDGVRRQGQAGKVRGANMTEVHGTGSRIMGGLYGTEVGTVVTNEAGV